MDVRQCAFLDKENEASIGLHYTMDNGKEFIINLTNGDILNYQEVAFVQDMPEWSSDFWDAKDAYQELAEMGEVINEVETRLEELKDFFGRITIAAPDKEIISHGDMGMVHIIPG